MTTLDVIGRLLKIAKFIIEHWDMILQSLATILGAVGVIVEAVNRLMPTESEDSALTRFGKNVAIAGEFVKKLLDKMRVPNVKK